jgi:hypothetical protein
MRNARTYIAVTAIRPLVRLADWSCMSLTGPDFRLAAGLIRKARM